VKRPLACLLAVAIMVVVLAGCGTSSNRAERATLAALNIPVPPTPPEKRTPTVTCRNVTASLRPPATLPGPSALPAGSDMAKIKRRGYLIAGVDQNTLLLSYFNPLTGRLEGFEIDMLRELARAIFGNPDAIQFKAITTTERIPAVRNGSVDVVADAMTITCDRKQQVDFSTVYYDAGQKVLVPSDSPARSIQDLDGRRVCATKGSTSILTLKTLFPNVRRYPVDQRTDCLVALQQGKVDGVTSDDSILLGFKAQDPDTKIVGARFADEPYGMAISKAHPDFVRFVNGVLERMRTDGEWRSIYSHWLGSPTPAPPEPSYSR
jgi:polar amino acid transport system substrate-binding protein